MSGYEYIKNLAKQYKCKIPELLVLAQHNDPFYAGSKTCKAMAEWFVGLWERFGYTDGVHLRRVHYQLISQENPKKHNGEPYENTINDWDYLCQAGKWARELGLISPGAFVDRRNPEPHIFYTASDKKIQELFIRFPDWDLPEISASLDSSLDWELPSFELSGYDYNQGLQPYHLEIWVEKSTQNDILLPLCQQYGINLVTGIGFMSITSVINLLKRIEQKPCRIFYISDFDPAGDGMPIAVARQIEYWVDFYNLDVDVKLEPIALTKEQVERYRLPRTPIKETDKRKGNFEERYGEGAVELDALEALYPNELTKIIKEYIDQYFDEDLEDKVEDTREDAEQTLQDEWEEKIEVYQDELEELQDAVAEINQKYEEKLEALNEDLQKELEPIKERVNSLRQAIQKSLDSIDLELPALPEPEVNPEEDDYLFDSKRGYSEQLEVYKNKKGVA